MLPHRARVDLGAMKGYSTFPKALALLEPPHQIAECQNQDTLWKRSYLSAEIKLVYSIATADLTVQRLAPHKQDDHGES